MYTSANCTLHSNHDRETWPHLQPPYNDKFLKGLKIARHYATTHQITNLLKVCINAQHFMLTNANSYQLTPIQHNPPQMHTFGMPCKLMAMDSWHSLSWMKWMKWLQ